MLDLQTRILNALAPQVSADAHAIGVSATCTGIQAVAQVEDQTVDVALGWAATNPREPVTPTTPFDIASVSKLFTATLAWHAVDRGLLDFDTPVVDHFPAFQSAATLAHLLNHTSGLPAWDQFYLRMPLLPDADQAKLTREAILDEILRAPLEPPGTVHAYSDLGFMLLGRWLETVFQQDLDALVRLVITGPLGMSHTGYVNQLRGDEPFRAAAITENTEGRPAPIRGVVHDENCYIQGGVAGHAGLFSTAEDLARFGRHFIDIARGKPGIVSQRTQGQAWKLAGALGSHVGGWDTPSGDLPSVGRGFPRAGTFGHLGFTGTSLWISPQHDVVAVLLTNRVFPTRENVRIRSLRVAYHEAVLPP